MFNIISEILKDLIPNKDLPNSVWISRYVMLVLTGFLGVYIFFRTLQNTNLGERYGFTKLEKQSTLTHLGFTYLSRSIRLHLKELDFNHPELESIFVVTRYDPETEFISIIPDGDDQLLLWEWLTVSKTNVRINNFEQILIENNEFFNSNKQCAFKKISEKYLNQIKDNVNSSSADSWIVCPVFVRNNLVANTMVIYDSTKVTNSEPKVLIADIRELNKKISDLFAYFNRIPV